jgi:protein-tyrosine phosphatase
METSLNLIKFEVEQGVTDIFVTPHYMMLRSFTVDANENESRFNELVKAVKDAKIDVNLILGNEIYCDRSIYKNLSTNTVRTLGNSKYLLIEFSLFEESEDIPEFINNLTAKGYIPIIAHPERYPYIKDIKAYTYLKRMGAMIQINADSVNGKYGGRTKKFVLNLIKNNLVDFIASDLHAFRNSKLLDAYNVIKKCFSVETAEKLFNNRVVLN